MREPLVPWKAKAFPLEFCQPARAPARRARFPGKMLAPNRALVSRHRLPVGNAEQEVLCFRTSSRILPLTASQVLTASQAPSSRSPDDSSQGPRPNEPRLSSRRVRRAHAKDRGPSAFSSARHGAGGGGPPLLMQQSLRRALSYILLHSDFLPYFLKMRLPRKMMFAENT